MPPTMPLPGGGPMIYGGPMYTGSNPGFYGAYGIAAANPKFAYVFQVPRSGNLDRFGIKILGVGQVPTAGLKFSFQDVSAGFADATVDQFANVTSGIAAGWLEPANYLGSTGLGSGTKRAVVEGDWIACVVEFVAINSGDALTMSFFDWGISVQPYDANAYFATWNGSAWTRQSYQPQFALRYDDGTYAPVCPYWWPATAINAFGVSSGSTPDELGLLFQVPAPLQLGGCWLQAAIGNDCQIVLYDASGAALMTHNIVALNSMNNAWQITRFARFPSVQLQPNVNYRLVVKGGASAATVYDVSIPSAAYLGAFDGGPSWMMTWRTDAGAWTDTPTRRPVMGLLVNGTAAAGTVGWTYLGGIIASSSPAAAATTGALNTTGATLLVAAVANATSEAVATVTDSAGNVWTPLTPQAQGGAGREQLFYVLAPITSAAHTFTAGAQTAFGMVIGVVAFGGTTFLLDSQNGALSGTPGTVSPVANGALLVAAAQATVGTPGATAAGAVGCLPFDAASVAVAGGVHMGMDIAIAFASAGAGKPSGFSFNISSSPSSVVAAFRPAPTSSGIGGGGGAPYALLAHTAKEIGTTPAINTTGATLFVVAEGNGGANSTIGDSMGNKWVKVPEVNSGLNYCALFYCLNPITSPTHTFTGFGTYNCLAVAAFTGGPPAAGTVVLANNSGAAATLPLPSLLPPVINALLVAAYSTGVPTTLTIDQGFTITDQLGGSSGQKVGLAYLVQTAAAAANPTWSASPSQAGAGAMLAFVIPSGPSSGGGEISTPF